MEAVTEQKILEELHTVKTKVIEIDAELHRIREDFIDARLSEEEKALVEQALAEEERGETVSIAQIKKKRGL